MVAGDDIRPEGLRISELAERTGASKELIHHYLRQGVLPACASRGRYSEAQLRLLHLVRQLREDFHLPLDTTRQVFERFDFDPERLEALFHGESLSLRLTRFAERSDLGLARSVSAEELTAEAQVDPALVTRLVEARILEPLPGTEPPRFSAYDVHVAALCHHGQRLGIPFAAFRTVASYVRVGFALQHRDFLDIDLAAPGSLETVLGHVFVRRELTSSFVQNVLQSQLQRFVHGAVGRPGGRRTRLDELVYRPSEAFVRRHGLDACRDRARDRTCREPGVLETWREAARLHLHAGAYQEAAFALEQALQRWPDDAPCHTLLGRALALAGDPEGAVAALERARRDPAERAAAGAYLALLHHDRWCAGEAAGQAATSELETIHTLADEMLRADDEAPVEARSLVAWLLTALPPAFHRRVEGRRTLAVLLTEPLPPRDGAPVPGLAERHRLNAAWLLLESLRRAPDDAPSGEPLPTAAELAALICRLDPASRLAERAFLENGDKAENGE